MRGGHDNGQQQNLGPGNLDRLQSLQETKYVGPPGASEYVSIHEGPQGEQESQENTGHSFGSHWLRDPKGQSSLEPTHLDPHADGPVIRGFMHPWLLHEEGAGSRSRTCEEEVW